MTARTAREVTDRNVVIVVGADAVQSGVAPVIRDIADRTLTGVLNTWPAKGLFSWNHPAHLGTMGLQARDAELASLAGFDDVVLCGVSNDELDRAELDRLGVRWREVLPADIATETFPARSEPTPRPALYTDLAAVCGPLYTLDDTPLNPARAAADLAGALPVDGVVCADAGRSGFWIGRTFATRTLGSVQLPIRAAAGFAATQAAMARRLGRFSVAIVDTVDTGTEAVMSRAKDLVVEVWTDDGSGDTLASQERLDRLLAAHHGGGVRVLRLAVDFRAINALVAVAGAPRWTA
jgi:thiamine pyrophosphate-dependent acetolactate synthase large subunit-like protein